MEGSSNSTVKKFISRERNRPNGSDPDKTALGELRRPWRWVLLPKFEDDIFGMSKRNYNAYANLATTRDVMVGEPTILDTGVGSSVVKYGRLPDVYHGRIKRE